MPPRSCLSPFAASGIQSTSKKAGHWLDRGPLFSAGRAWKGSNSDARNQGKPIGRPRAGPPPPVCGRLQSALGNPLGQDSIRTRAETPVPLESFPLEGREGLEPPTPGLKARRSAC